MFNLGLATIIIGNGLLKPNISSLLGIQYENQDPGRDSGFTLFYIGINVGAALSGISGYVRNAFGWHAAFALASAGMLIGILAFLYGRKYIKQSQNLKSPGARLQLQLFAYCLLAIIGVSFLFRMNILTYWLLPCVGMILLVYLVILIQQQTPEHEIA